jgi:hypothetical protein
LAKKRVPKPSAKRPRPGTRKLEVARGPRLRALLRKHPEVQAVLKSLDLKLDVQTGRILAIPFFGAHPSPKRRKPAGPRSRKK